MSDNAKSIIVKVSKAVSAALDEFHFSVDAFGDGVGHEAARKRGVRFGRPRKLALDQGELARRLVSEEKSVRVIVSVFNVHPATIYRLANYRQLDRRASWPI